MPCGSRLTLVPRSSRGLSYEVEDVHAPCLIGRDAEARIRLADRTISRRHAMLICEAGDWYLHDQSQNGTRINGQLFKGARVKLRNGDHVRIGVALDHTVVIVSDHTDETTMATEIDTTVAVYPEDRLRVLNAGEIWIGQRRLDLSEQESRLVRLLEAARGKHCSNEEIIRHVFNGVGNSANVQELVKRVREKIRRQTGQDGRRYIAGYHDGYVLHTRPRPQTADGGRRLERGG